MEEKKSDELKNISYELFIGALSVLSIANLFLFWLLPDEDVSAVILIIDLFLSAIFMTDFLYRLFSTKAKANYFFRQMGWADLLASLPLPQFKILRLFRIIRVYRLMKLYGGKRMIKDFLTNRGGSALLTLFFIMLLILEFGALAMLSVESGSPNANIVTASDAVWYVYVTITTVGYGDQYPVTQLGRFIGILIMAIGVGLFGTITAFLANIFIRPAEEKAEEQENDPAVLMVKIEEIRDLLLAQEKAHRRLDARMARLESFLEGPKE